MNNAPSRALRIGLSVGLSAVINLGLVVALAEMDSVEPPDDPHDDHRVRPSVVPPPPPPTPSTSLAPPSATSATPLPAAPPAPRLELPALGRLGDGPGLAWGGLDDVGLGSLDGFGLPAAKPATAASDPDEPPRLAAPPDLGRFYPREARRRGLGGRTIVAVEVDARGRVGSLRILRSEPPGLFERSAERAVRSFTFEPARRDGRSVPASTRLELKWQPRN